MKESFIMKRIVSTEYLLLAMLTVILFVSFAGFEWWWLFVIFPIVEVSAFGYLKNSHIGAAIYNLGHSLVGPAILVAIYIFGADDWALLIGMAWVFNIFVNRALGYGMKHTEGFHHTHLGKVGKAKRSTKKPLKRKK